VRGVVLGLCIGIVIGVTVAPMIASLDGSSASGTLDRWASTLLDRQELDRSLWPTGEQILASVFDHQGWDGASAASSSATISTCISVNDDITCKFDLNLAWLDQPRSAEAIFEEDAGQWHIRELKAH
jgi:hypothetical protein